MTVPSYLHLDSAELRRRAQEAVAALADCRLCPRDCGADPRSPRVRKSQGSGACMLSRETLLAHPYPPTGCYSLGILP